MGRLPDAASVLVQLLDFSPTDSEAWSELSDIYLSQGLYPQAIYALEEVLVLAPNAWNVCNPTTTLGLSPMLMHLPRSMRDWASCNTWPLPPREPAVDPIKNTWPRRSSASRGALSCATITSVVTMA